ncbi:MAG: hypothetical protein F8N38_16305 [Hungatella sp.]|nr:hypothetical protein [Hungatella sp.]
MKRKIKNVMKYIKYNEPNSYIILEIIIFALFFVIITSEYDIIKIIVFMISFLVFVSVLIKRLIYTRKYSTKYLKFVPAIFTKKSWINQRLCAIKGESVYGLKKDMYSIKKKLIPGITYYVYTHELVKLNLDSLAKKGIITEYHCEKARMKTMKKKHVVNLKLAAEEQQFYYISFKFVGEN